MNKWQLLKIVSGVLFLMTAVILEIYGTKSRNVRILEGLLVFLGIFYILSPMILSRIFKKINEN
ncbi:MAG: hypothetical protein AB1426_00485 [Bacillota bacterium]